MSTNNKNNRTIEKENSIERNSINKDDDDDDKNSNDNNKNNSNEKTSITTEPSSSSSSLPSSAAVISKSSCVKLSQELKEYYSSHNIDVTDSMLQKIHDNTSNNNNTPFIPHRFIRLNPRFDQKETLDMLTNEIQYNYNRKKTTSDSNINNTNEVSSSSSKDTMSIKKVPWLDEKWGFYALPGSFSLSKSTCFRSGRIYGMDVSSGASVVVLLSDQYDVIVPLKENEKAIMINNKNSKIENNNNNGLSVLDLCCCPGLKLCTIADYLQQDTKTNNNDNNNNNNNNNSSKIVGVDISEQRMALCKRIVEKYHIDPETSSSSSSSSRNNNNNNSQTINSNKDVISKKANSYLSIPIRLYCQDGTKFGRSESNNNSQTNENNQNSKECKSNNNHDDSNKTSQNNNSNLVFDSQIAIEEFQQRNGKRKRMNKSAVARQRKRLRQAEPIIDWIQNNKTTTTTDSSNTEKLVETQRKHKGTTTTSTTNSCFNEPVVNITKPMKSIEVHDTNTTNSNETKTIEKQKIEWFDRVLVDAECSTDGSLKHIIEQQHDWKEKSSSSETAAAVATTTRTTVKVTTNDLLIDPMKLSELVQLQKQLIASGFDLLKPGGYMVYSTCSLSYEQNENVVQWLVDEYSNQQAYIVPIYFPLANNKKDDNNNTNLVMDTTTTATSSTNHKNNEQQKQQNRQLVGEGNLPGTIRFYPNLDPLKLFGGGFFLAKLGKRKNQSNG